MGRNVKQVTELELQLQITQALRRTATRPSITGYRPQDHQKPFHASNKQGRLLIGGNRSGKTVGGAAEMVMRLTGRHIYENKFRLPVRCRAIGVDFDNGINKIILPEIARWIPPSELINGSWEDSYSKGNKMLTLANGSTCEFMSYDQDVDKFAGTSRHFIWFDEEPPEDIFNENMLRLVDTGGNWWMTMTPLFDMSWTFDRLYEAGKSGLDPNIEVFVVSTDQNTYVNMVELEALTSGLSDEEKNARRHGTYIQNSGTIYGKYLTDDIFIPSMFEDDPNIVERWSTIYNSWGHFGMLDHGFRNPTAFLLGAYDENGRIIIYDEYYESGKLVHENAEAIKEKIAKLKLQDKLSYIIADPSIKNTDPISGSSIHQEYAEHGLYLSLANNDVISGINRVTSRLKTKNLYITKNCHKLRWELNRYRWDKYTVSKTAGRKNLKETPVKKDDHACDALRYGIVSRPALSHEEELSSGNILNAPVAQQDDHFVDLEFTKEFIDKKEIDFTLGDDW